MPSPWLLLPPLIALLGLGGWGAPPDETVNLLASQRQRSCLAWMYVAGPAACIEAW